MNAPELREPIFPLTGGFSLPRPMRAPRLLARPAELKVDTRIFPGAWSAQHSPAPRASLLPAGAGPARQW